jgi:hypothetical protein
MSTESEDSQIYGLGECGCCPPTDFATSEFSPGLLSRRGFLAATSAIPLAACAGSGADVVRSRQAPDAVHADPSDSSSSLPLVDFHTHLQRDLEASKLIEMMNLSRVARPVLMPLYYGDGNGAVNDGLGSDEQALRFARAYPGRFIPFIGMQRGELLNDGVWQYPDSSGYAGGRLLRETEAKLRSGEYFGIGEFMFRFYPYRTSLGNVAVSDMRFPPDSPLMHRFAELAAKYRVPVVMHCEAEPEFSEQMTRLVGAHPDATFIWAHNCGRSSAEQIIDLFNEFRNLRADLGLMMNTGGEGYGSYWPQRTPWMHLIADSDGTLYPEMKALFERFPDRFYIGTDTAHARVYSYYHYRAGLWRHFLEQVTAATARKIAFENADQLFGATSAAATLEQTPISSFALTT